MPSIDIHHAITFRLAQYIERESFSIFRSFADVADEVGVSESLVRNIFTSGAERREKERIVQTPEWLAIDEVYLGASEHCVITDPLARKVLDVLPDNKQTTLAKWLLQLPDRHRVRLVTTDMYEAYRAAVGLVISQARIVVDRYHVHNLLNMALKDVLLVIRDGMRPSEQRRHMRDPRLLFKSRFHLSAVGDGQSQKQLVAKWLEEVPLLGKAYWLKEGLSDILQLSDRRRAEDATDTWLEQASDFVMGFSSAYKRSFKAGQPFSNVLTTVSKWRSQILNYVEYKDHFKAAGGAKVTNAFAEMANRQIKTAYRLGNGFNYEIIRAKVVHGGITVCRRPPHPLDDEAPRTRAARPTGKRRRGAGGNAARLETARAERDETTGLIPNPGENARWADRFGSFEQLKLAFTVGGEGKGRNKGKVGRGKGRPREEVKQDRRHRVLKSNPDQLKMF